MPTFPALQSPCADSLAGGAPDRLQGDACAVRASGAEALAPPPCWLSQALLGRGTEAHIRHGDVLYRLRLTRQGKLILTK